MFDPDKPSKCKVGITINIEQRLRSYRTASPQCTFTYTTEIPNKRFEKEIHELLKDTILLDREYVHCNPTIVQNIIEGYMTDKGY